MVKFDIEFSEWPAIRTMLKEGCLSQIKQIAFETHAWKVRHIHDSNSTHL